LHVGKRNDLIWHRLRFIRHHLRPSLLVGAVVLQRTGRDSLPSVCGVSLGDSLWRQSEATLCAFSLRGRVRRHLFGHDDARKGKRLPIPSAFVLNSDEYASSGQPR
jgi:hypothetical protein